MACARDQFTFISVTFILSIYRHFTSPKTAAEVKRWLNFIRFFYNSDQFLNRLKGDLYNPFPIKVNWYERTIPRLKFTVILWIGVVGLIGGIIGLITYIVLGATHHEKGKMNYRVTSDRQLRSWLA